jgi:hypothetical protein
MAWSKAGTAPTVTLPDGTKAKPDIAGATAEWIVERPAIPGQKTVYNFPDYGHTEFDHCVAVEGDGVDIFSLLGGCPRSCRARAASACSTCSSIPRAPRSSRCPSEGATRRFGCATAGFRTDHALLELQKARSPSSAWGIG